MTISVTMIKYYECSFEAFMKSQEELCMQRRKS